MENMNSKELILARIIKTDEGYFYTIDNYPRIKLSICNCKEDCGIHANGADNERCNGCNKLTYASWLWNTVNIK
jgi:hypothetical protein